MRRHAFTLIELVIVIAIIALLMSLTLTITRRIRGQARAMVCQSHIRQLGLSFFEYDTQIGKLPYGFNADQKGIPPGGNAGTGGVDPWGWWWFHYCGFSSHSPFNPQPILSCPSKRIDSDALQRNELWGNYGVNWSICKSPWAHSGFNIIRGTPLGIDDIKQPAQTMLLMDSGYAVISWYHATLDIPVTVQEKPGFTSSYIPGLSINKDPKKYLIDPQRTDAEDGRHPGKTVNVGYIDGHIQQIKAEDCLVEKTEDSYRNVYPFWDIERP